MAWAPVAVQKAQKAQGRKQRARTPWSMATVSGSQRRRHLRTTLSARCWRARSLDPRCGFANSTHHGLRGGSARARPTTLRGGCAPLHNHRQRAFLPVSERAFVRACIVRGGVCVVAGLSFVGVHMCVLRCFVVPCMAACGRAQPSPSCHEQRDYQRGHQRGHQHGVRGVSRVEPSIFDEALSGGRRLIIVGDSLSKQHAISLSCLLFSHIDQPATLRLHHATPPSGHTLAAAAGSAAAAEFAHAFVLRSGGMVQFIFDDYLLEMASVRPENASSAATRGLLAGGGVATARYVERPRMRDGVRNGRRIESWARRLRLGVAGKDDVLVLNTGCDARPPPQLTTQLTPWPRVVLCRESKRGAALHAPRAHMHSRIGSMRQSHLASLMLCGRRRSMLDARVCSLRRVCHATVRIGIASIFAPTAAWCTACWPICWTHRLPPLLSARHRGHASRGPS
jgi:hypothetical protein